jgi:hypothetical protein
MIDTGTVIHGMVVESVSFDPPEVWLSCGHGHRVWATPRILESGPVKCKECESDQAIRMKAAQIAQEAREEIDAGDWRPV